MSVWRPWDADDNEYEQRSLIRELIPASLRAPVLAWIRMQLRPTGAYAHIDMSRVHDLQSALQIDFRLQKRYVEADDMLSTITQKGDQFIARVVDYFLSYYTTDHLGRAPSEVDSLRRHFDNAASSAEIALQNGVFRLRRRTTDGIEELAEASAQSTSVLAGQHLRKGWVEAYALSPNTSLVMSEAIKAVEAAAHPVVSPKATKVRLGMITQAIKDQTGWTLAFPNRDDGHPDHKAVLVGMLETLIVAQADRHGGASPSVLEAQGHVQLASILVQWFSTGVVRRDTTST
ncbi:hypothetical protein [Microbacterium flavum]|uniref:Uncharacterized protein n=1 Tax=Microbacterium flavum TaxID=415216 RepID=A0ABS5XVS1_9MICO|nr:hypothetical protein [Microbacterium flavum]MBT8798632.1 hypothetical protein [Microbacterium flavum]